MADIQTTSYRAAELYTPKKNETIYAQLPDQFTNYDRKLYNPFNFYTSSGEFNLGLFNKTFREEQLKRIDFFRKAEQQRLEELNRSAPPPADLHQLTVGQYVRNMKDTFFDVANDLQTKPLSTEILMKNNRLFYIGLLLIIIFVIYLVLSNLTQSANK
jgi:hypothetical protein